MSDTPTYIKLQSTRSTNSYLAERVENCANGTVVSTFEQTAGRGQRGNSWEAAAGENLTFSILLRPQNIDARQQFIISEIVSIAIVDVLQTHIPNNKVAIKWPNDIYVEDKKICGILIENSLMGTRITHSIAGIGINVNQKIFFSDAPNPISIYNLINKKTSIDKLLDETCTAILRFMAEYPDKKTIDILHRQYFSQLWRNDGYYPYKDTATQEIFEARIADVSTSGILTLQDKCGNQRSYAFKEVSAIL